MKINPNKNKALSFSTARVKDPLNYSFGDQNIPAANCCKYLGIMSRSYLSWADQVNYTGSIPEYQISALDRVQNKAAKFSHSSWGSDWESLAQRRKIAGICALYRAYTGERSWEAIGDKLQAPSYLSTVDFNWKIRAREQRTDVGKYSFVNRTITDWNRLPGGAIGTSTVKRIFSRRGLGKCKPVRGSEENKK